MRNSKNSPDVQTLVDLWGLRRAVDVMMELGGSRQHVPKNPGNRLVHALTVDELEKLRDGWAGEAIVFPIGRAVCISTLYYVDGLDVPTIARRLAIGEDGVRKSLAAGIHPIVRDDMRKKPQ